MLRSPTGFVVTSLAIDAVEARVLYEDVYCARGEMENRIKEQLMLFADRTSTATLRANQLRLYASSIAYVLLHALRRLGLAGTELGRAQCQTIRLTLLKIGARVRRTVRKVWLAPRQRLSACGALRARARDTDRAADALFTRQRLTDSE